MTARPDPLAARTCFGYAVEPGVELVACRPGPGAPLRLSEVDVEPDVDGPPLLEWHEEGRPFARLWADDPRFTLWIQTLGWFGIDASAPSITLPAATAGIRREARLWGVPAALCFTRRGDLPLHAAAIDVDGAAVVLAAPGRFGKTTLAAACMQAGHRVLSEDLTCVRGGPAPSVVPGPAVLRIRPDTFTALGFTDGDSLDEDETRRYVVPPAPRRGDATPVPLRAIVLLRTQQEGPVSVEGVTDPASVMPDLWTLSFNLPTDADRARCFAAITDLVASVPVYNLNRVLTFDSLPALVASIERCAR